MINPQFLRTDHLTTTAYRKFHNYLNNNLRSMERQLLKCCYNFLEDTSLNDYENGKQIVSHITYTIKELYANMREVCYIYVTEFEDNQDLTGVDLDTYDSLVDQDIDLIIDNLILRVAKK